jgi:hypothetical protein
MFLVVGLMRFAFFYGWWPFFLFPLFLAVLLLLGFFDILCVCSFLNINNINNTTTTTRDYNAQRQGNLSPVLNMGPKTKSTAKLKAKIALFGVSLTELMALQSQSQAGLQVPRAQSLVVQLTQSVKSIPSSP